VLSSILLVTAFRSRCEQGGTIQQAIDDAARDCLREILMTSLVASVGFFPMATSVGVGAEVQRPLATVVIGGVVASLIMSLLVLPVMLAVVNHRASLAAVHP